MELKFIPDNVCNIYRPDPKWVQDKKWSCRIYLMDYDRIESNFIANAIQTISPEAIEFIVDDQIYIKGHNQVTVDYVNSFYSLDRDIDIGISCAGFTDKNISYLYFKDQENDIFMLFGSETFVNQVMPISLDEYEKYYKEFYGAWASEKIDKLLERLWYEYPR